MLKTKKILVMLLAILLLIAIPTIANAAVEYTREFPSSDGTIRINFTGLTLEEGKSYKFALTRQNVEPTNWFYLDDGYTTTNASITLSPSVGKIVEILKVTDTGYVYIKDESDTTGTYVLNAYPVNLKLMYLNSLQYTKTDTDYDIYNKIYGSIGHQYDWYGQVHWQTQKVTDETFIEEFLKDKNNILRLENYLPNAPTSGGYSSTGKPKFSDMSDGLYLIWVYRTGENCKTIYSCIVHDGLPEATTVGEYLGITSTAAEIIEIKAKAGSSTYTNTPSGWEYQVKAGDEVSITIKFEEAIVLNESPKLTVKFGTGSNIELTTNVVSSDTLTYKYTVKSGDRGALQILDLQGGNVTNNSGTPVDLTLIDVTGSPVVAIESDEPNDEPIDATTYVSFPWIIYNGKGEVEIYEYKYDGVYTLYYQFVEETEDIRTEIEALNTKYKNGEITYEEYFKQYNELPNKYNEENWIKTEDGSFEAKLSEFEGTKTFVLWVKAVMADKTVYEYQVYTMNGTGQSTNVPTTQDTLVKKEFNNRQYYIFEKNMSWEEAKAYCESLGGYLVTITSAEEQAFIEGYIKEKGLTGERFWIGAYRTNKESKWQWVTQEKFEYSNLGEFSGTEFGPINSYGLFDPTGREYGGNKISPNQWDAVTSEINYVPFICEWGEIDKQQDNTSAPVVLPNTGNAVYVIIAIIAVVTLGTIGFIKYKKISKIV